MKLDYNINTDETLIINIKKGDLIKCINIERCSGITIGGIYRVIELDEQGDPKIINDNNNCACYLRTRFINIIEERKEKLEKLKLNEKG